MNLEGVSLLSGASALSLSFCRLLKVIPHLDPSSALCSNERRA